MSICCKCGFDASCTCIREMALVEIAKAAEKINVASDPFQAMIEAIRNVPEQMQMMLDSIVAIQDEFPMPEDGWEQFVKDVEYTNQKHGLNLVIRSPQ